MACDPLSESDAQIGTLAALLEGAEVVLSLAGSAAGGEAALGDHARLARVLARAAAQVGAPLLIASSAAIYGRPTGPAPLHEDDMPATDAGLGPYGAAKWAMETASAGFPDVCCLRIGNVAGADAILGGWRSGFALDVLADGRTPLRSYIGPETLAQVLAALVCAAPGGGLPRALNIAQPGPVAMGDLLDAAGLPWAPRPAGPQTLARVMLDTTRLADLGCAPARATPESLVAEWRASASI